MTLLAGIPVQKSFTAVVHTVHSLAIVHCKPKKRKKNPTGTCHLEPSSFKSLAVWQSRKADELLSTFVVLKAFVCNCKTHFLSCLFFFAFKVFGARQADLTVKAKETRLYVCRVHDYFDNVVFSDWVKLKVLDIDKTGTLCFHSALWGCDVIILLFFYLFSCFLWCI